MAQLYTTNGAVEITVYSITIKPISKSDAEDIATLWLTLEASSSQSVFLSWSWIGTWLAQVIEQQPCFLVTATDSGKQIKGLGLFCQNTRRYFGPIKAKQWHLHKTGETKFDQIWLEYNDFLLADDCADSLRQAMWFHLFHHNPFAVDHWLLGVSQSSVLNALTPPNTIATTIDNEDIGYVFATADHASDYPKSISVSTYKQVRKTKQLLAAKGQVKFEFTTEPRHITALLAITKQWHIDKWQETPTPSGFTNPAFYNFHQGLIAKGKAALSAIYLDGEVIAVNYYLIDANRIYFYLSALKPMADNKIKLGLYSHCQSIEYISQQPEYKHLKYYDLLAGDANYKRKLATQKVAFVEVSFEVKTILWRLKAIAMSLRNIIKR